jgi:hypothetical protein
MSMKRTCAISSRGLLFSSPAMKRNVGGGDTASSFFCGNIYRFRSLRLMISVRPRTMSECFGRNSRHLDEIISRQSGGV